MPALSNLKTVARERLREAFTLIETLVVVSIIVLILALTAPSLMQTMQSSKLTSAGDSLVGFCSEAQQLAMSLNLPVEARFFRYTTPMNPVQNYRSYQLFKVVNPITSSGAVSEKMEPVGQLVRLPDSVVIVFNNALSPLLGQTAFPDEKDGGGTYSGVDKSASPQYCAVRFLPDGSCRPVVSSPTTGVATLQYLSLPNSCFTLVSNNGGNTEVTPTTLPKNFYTIQIDPYTSKTRSYRPGQY